MWINILKRLNTFLVFIFLFCVFFSPESNFIDAQNKRKAPASKKKKKRVRTFRVDFREKDIHDFLKAMSRIIGKNIIADDQVKGKITVISPKPIPRERAFAYFTSVLAVKGYGVVVEDKLLRVITLEEAVAKGRLIHIGKKPLKKVWVKENIVITAIVGIDHADPIRLSGILKKITNKGTAIVEYKETESIILTGGALEVDRLLRIINQVDKPYEDKEEETIEAGDINIIRLKNLEAGKAEQVLRKISLPEPPKKPGDAPVKKRIDIVAHKESNSLIYVGEKADWKNVKKIINSIDIPRNQILLEMLIAEVSQGDANIFGVDWRYQSSDQGIYQFNSGAVKGAIASGNIDTEGRSQNDVFAQAFNTIDGFSLGFLQGGTQTILGLLNSNISRENFLVLSAPQILTLDNQEAEINVGEDVPVQTAQKSSGGGDSASIINQYDYRPTGVKLKVTPQVNSQNEITLKLYQEIKEAVDSGAVLQPRFTKRELKTTIKVKNKQTIVIGGLISTKRTKSERKIPLLGDIPLLGYLFKRTSTVSNRTNLLVFITPHILTSRAIADAITEELRQNQIKSFKEHQN